MILTNHATTALLLIKSRTRTVAFVETLNAFPIFLSVAFGAND